MFWGRIRGTTKDYYLAIGYKFKDEYEFPAKRFYWRYLRDKLALTTLFSLSCHLSFQNMLKLPTRQPHTSQETLLILSLRSSRMKMEVINKTLKEMQSIRTL